MLTELAVILDRSGSMANVASDIQHGFDHFIEEQKANPVGACKVSLTQFDSIAVETLYNGTPLAEVPKLVLRPRGNTPLLDAIGKTIAALKERMDKEPAPAEGRRVLVMILTDGQENASREYTRAQIKSLIETQTAAGWDFMYLGANVDAFTEISSLGIQVQNSSGYTSDSAGVQASLRAVSTRVSDYRSTGNAGFSEQERSVIGHSAPAPSTTPAPAVSTDRINP